MDLYGVFGTTRTIEKVWTLRFFYKRRVKVVKRFVVLKVYVARLVVVNRSVIARLVTLNFRLVVV